MQTANFCRQQRRSLAAVDLGIGHVNESGAGNENLIKDNDVIPLRTAADVQGFLASFERESSQ